MLNKLASTKTNKIYSAILILLLFFLQKGLSAQNKDSIDYKYWDSVITNESVQSDTEAIKNQKNELFNDLGISYSKDKIVLVKKNIGHYPVVNKMDSVKFYTQYILWLIDLKTGHSIILAKTKNKEFGIYQPSWSPDGKWINFTTFSLGGHSPLKTNQLWVIDSSGKRLQHIKLPSPYGRFSSGIIKWEGVHDLLISGVNLEYKSGKWEEIKMKFSYDCESRIISSLK